MPVSARTISGKELEALLRDKEVLFGTRQQPSLMLSQDNEIIKFFYRRKRWSTSRFYPQASRFHANSQRLGELKINAPMVKEIIHCPDVPTDLIIYDRLDGCDLRTLCEQGKTKCLVELTEFLINLHDKGIYFRAIHLANVLKQNDGMAIVDISDLSTQSRPLSPWQRARNIAHLFNARYDQMHFQQYGLERFVNDYLARGGLSKREARWLRWRLIFSLDAKAAHQFH